MFDYDLNYLELTLRKNSKTFEAISDIRWNFLNKTLLDLGEKEIGPVLDYGCGVGAFRAYRPEGVEVDSYDINRLAPQTGILKPEYNVVCFFDVLEHMGEETMDNILEFTRLRTKYIYATVPIFQPKENEKLKNWRHYKPGEHLQIFLSSGLFVEAVKNCGYELVIADSPECPPRTDIISYIFRAA